MKQLFTLIFVLGVSASAFADDNYYGFEGEGTEANPYKISSAADFTTLAQKIDADHTALGEYFILTDDINFGGTEESPVQLPSIARASITNVNNVAYGFQGILDGNSKTISGIYHTNCGNDDAGKYNAIISSLGKGGVVKNLTFSADNYIKAHSYSAPFVALNNGTIENCVNNANIIVTNSTAGGICGTIIYAEGTIKDCTNNGDISASSFAAGIVGFVVSNSKFGTSDVDYANVIVDNCTNTGDISTTTGTGSAGIAGSFAGALTNCTNSGSVDDSKGTAKAIQYTGGIVGIYGYISAFSGNTNTGSVTGSKYVGGLIGLIRGNAEEAIELSDTNVNTGEVTGEEFVGNYYGSTTRTAQVIITDVDSLNADFDSDDNAVYYNLAGQRVSRYTKGIVISNGRKFFNK